MSACPLLDVFQKNLDMPIAFGLSMFTVTSGNLTGMKIFYWDFLGGWGNVGEILLRRYFCE
jgi:hypothetical protein